MKSQHYLEYVTAETYDVEVQLKVNSITSPFYTKEIVPKYLEELQNIKPKRGYQEIFFRRTTIQVTIRTCISATLTYTYIKNEIETLVYPT